MQAISLTIPESLEYMMDNFIKAGVFESKEEMVLAALSEFVKKNQLELLDYYANQDIEWALREKELA